MAGWSLCEYSWRFMGFKDMGIRGWQYECKFLTANWMLNNVMCPTGFLFPLLIQVEDFLDRSQNFARSVGKIEMQKIYRCIHGSLSNLSCFLIGQIEASKLKALLFGSMHLNIPSDQILHGQGMKRTRGHLFSDSDSLLDPITTKKARYTDRTREPYGYETPTAPPNPSIPLLRTLLPSHPHNGAYHLGSPVIPFHKSYGLEYDPQYLAGSSQLAYGLQHEQQLLFAQLGYGSEQLHPRPFHFYPGSQLHQHEQNLMNYRTWNDMEEVWSGNSEPGCDLSQHAYILWLQVIPDIVLSFGVLVYYVIWSALKVRHAFGVITVMASSLSKLSLMVTALKGFWSIWHPSPHLSLPSRGCFTENVLATWLIYISVMYVGFDYHHPQLMFIFARSLLIKKLSTQWRSWAIQFTASNCISLVIAERNMKNYDFLRHFLSFRVF